MKLTEREVERGRLKAEYGKLFDAVAEILWRHDPIRICDEANPDEYEPEVETILPRLKTCRSAADVLTVVYQEFARWFGADTAGPEDVYREAAEEIWDVWQKRRGVDDEPHGRRVMEE
jgi:hypothetical protein